MLDEYQFEVLKALDITVYARTKLKPKESCEKKPPAKPTTKAALATTAPNNKPNIQPHQEEKKAPPAPKFMLALLQIGAIMLVFRIKSNTPELAQQQLLNNMLTKCGYDSNKYPLNVLTFRWPQLNTANFDQSEKIACESLRVSLQSLKKRNEYKIIICFGDLAARYMFPTSKFSELRSQKELKFCGQTAIVTEDVDAMLENAQLRKQTWQDIALLRTMRHY